MKKKYTLIHITLAMDNWQRLGPIKVQSVIHDMGSLFVEDPFDSATSSRKLMILITIMTQEIGQIK